MIKIDGFVMDLAISEEIVFPGEATKYPAEVGSEFSDHIRDLPPEVTLECIVSDSPIGDIANNPSRESADGENPLPSADALAKLREMKSRRRPVTIETSIGVFDSMACTEISVPVDKEKSPGTKDRAGALFFTAKFQKITIVTNRRARVRVRSAMSGAGGKAKPKVVAAGQQFDVEDIVVWKHANPPGSFNYTGLQTRVRVAWQMRQGQTLEEAIHFSRVNIGNTTLHYFELGSTTEILQPRRGDLIKDLDRDRLVKQGSNFNDALLRQIRENESRPAFDRNLPDGVDLDRFQQPAPSTFAPTATESDLSRFQRRIPPTFPPAGGT